MVSPLIPDGILYYSFMVILGRCDGSYNIAKDSFGKIRNPNKRRYKFGSAQYDKRDEW